MSKRRQTFTADQVTVTYDPNLCMHAAECVRRLPAVFDPSAARRARTHPCGRRLPSRSALVRRGDDA